MGKKCGVDIRDLENFKKNLEKNLGEKQVDSFIEACAKELAARLLRRVTKLTPTGVYPKETGKSGGTLKRGWTKGKDIQSYVEGLKVHHFGNTYVIEIVNETEYASYVEYGHRQEPGRYVPAIGKRLKKDFVEGKRMLTLSEDEIRNIAPKVLENKLKKKLEECFK